ncbi:MAG: hypothetical protein MUE87_00360 [Methanothrix sp.]|jgi:hypothetical protein|nr:hypothetical protein [Methanothrix sp.]
MVLAVALIGMAASANYMYEKASVKGMGYKNVEMIISTQTGFNGQKLVEKESGSGNVITERTELEAERQLTRTAEPIGAIQPDPDADFWIWGPCQWPTGMKCPMDYINFTKDAEFEYMPVSYQTGTYDQKWLEKLCVQNYRIGAVLTEMYTHAEHLQKTTEVKTRGYSRFEDLQTVPPDPEPEPEPPSPPDPPEPPGPGPDPGPEPVPSEGSNVEKNSDIVYPAIQLDGGCPYCCTGVLEANLNSNVIGVAHIGWLSRDPQADPQLKGRHAEYGRSIEDLTGVFSIEKFIQLWGNSTCGAISVDWLPCV